jgi:hypothetical protein
LAEDFGEILETVEGLVGDRFVGEGPKALGRLELGRVGRQITRMEPFRKLEIFAVMPAGIVEQQDGRLVFAKRALLGEAIEDRLEQGDVDRVGNPPHHFAGGRPDEGIEVEPFVLVAAHRHGPLSFLGPDAANDRLQPEAMLVESPDFERLSGGRSWVLNAAAPIPRALAPGGL